MDEVVALFGGGEGQSRTFNGDRFGVAHEAVCQRADARGQGRAEEGGLPLAQALKQAQLTASTSEALRMIEQGGVKLDGERVSDRGLKLAKGTVAVAQVGKRKFARITVV